jgi:hypothetical protein
VNALAATSLRFRTQVNGIESDIRSMKQSKLEVRVADSRKKSLARPVTSSAPTDDIPLYGLATLVSALGPAFGPQIEVLANAIAIVRTAKLRLPLGF